MTDTASFTGKYAVITGSTQGLGEATAHLLADRGAAGIIVTGRNAERGANVVAALKAKGCDAHFVQADLADTDAPHQIIAAANQHFGTLHILVNAAALTARGSIWDTAPDFWDKMMNVNVRAPFFLMQDAVKIMYRDGVTGSIINITSISANGGQPFLTPYSTSKGALVTLTRNVAYAVMPHKIRVNALNLGWMDTPGEDAIQREFHGGEDGWLEKAEADQPFGRLIKTGEAARAIAFLASDESGLLTGAIIEYDQTILGAGNRPKPTLDEWGTEGVPYD